MTDLKFSIRRAVPEDAAGVAAMMADEAVFPGLLQLPYPRESSWQERLKAGSNEGDLQLLAVAEGEVIGHAGVFGSPQMRRRHAGGIVMAVIGHAQNKGVGTALMNALTDYADRWTTFSRLELNVYADNVPGIALYKKSGFEQEGVHKNYSLRAGRYHDVISMARFSQTLRP